MPRDSSGNYTLPAGNPVVPGTTIQSSWANTTLDDIADGITDSLDRSGRGGMLAPLEFADGTVSLPGISWSNELTTGFYRAATGDMRASALGADVAIFRSNLVQFNQQTIVSEIDGGLFQQFVVNNANTSPISSSPVAGIALQIAGVDETVLQVNTGVSGGTNLFDVSGDCGLFFTSTGAVRLYASSGSETNSNFQIGSSGNVGVGTGINPQYLLHVKQDIGVSIGSTVDTDADDIVLECNTSGGITIVNRNLNQGTIAFNNATGRRGAISYSNSSETFQFSTGGGIRGAWNTTGFVIGDTVPARPFTVRTAGGIEVGVDGDGSFFVDTNTLFVDAVNNRVGIGTSSPSSPLHINSSSPSLRFQDSTDASYSDIIYDGGNYAFRADQGNTGLGTAMFFSVDGTERMRIDSTGNVGIGTSSPSHRLDVNGEIRLRGTGASTESGLLHLYYVNATNRATLTSDSSGAVLLFAGSPSAERLRVSSGGFLGVGVSNPNVSVDVLCESSSAIGHRLRGRAADNLGYIQFTDNVASVSYGTVSASSGGLTLTADGARGLYFVANSSERMRIDASGNLLVGTSSTSSLGTVNTGVVLRKNTDSYFARNTDGSLIAFFSGSGFAGTISVSGSTTAYNTSSDIRLKENIVDAPSAQDDIAAVQIRSFDWKAGGSHQKYGVVAQELVEIAPEAVSQGETWGVDYSKLVPMMIKAIQELTQRVKQLEAV